MNKTAFVKTFGSVFEHSPWVAERAFERLPEAAQTDAAAVCRQMCEAFDEASSEERLGVLNAHPDLAGKLAQAKRLTAASTAEQASAGLDALTDDERAEFTALNADYVAKFQFPFIICVRDYDKPSILDAFKSRVSGDSESEFVTACEQVKRIAFHRINALIEAPHD